MNKVVAFVTGGASGLGQSVVRRVALGGGRCVIADLPTSAGAQIAADLNKETGSDNVVFAPVDVRDEFQVSAGLDAANKWGGINVGVNCAGICPAIKTLGRKGVHPLDKFQAVMDINIVGTFNVVRLAAERMAKLEPMNADGQRGVLINVASVSAYEGQIGQVAYAASKGAIVSMTLPLARELKSQGIRVCAVAPGIFETPLVAALPDKVKADMGSKVPFPPRLGNPEEFAHAVEFIISNPFMNGETIRLDGAIRMQA